VELETLRLPITALFVDVGGVLLTNGWDHLARKRAVKHFKLEWAAKWRIET
jgi:outer membrane protein assembly factor BamA